MTNSRNKCVYFFPNYTIFEYLIWYTTQYTQIQLILSIMLKKSLLRKYPINLIIRYHKHIYVLSSVIDSDPVQFSNWYAFPYDSEICNCPAEDLVYLNMTICELICSAKDVC